MFIGKKVNKQKGEIKNAHNPTTWDYLVHYMLPDNLLALCVHTHFKKIVVTVYIIFYKILFIYS